ncbi:MAG: PAS domain-containing protein [Bacteroidetes bacterium]|nr:PAS domain-containing protein [Bacteroidota bacterium]MBT7828023.1 PAS domain-containing protein [Bacteroidota bacterium]
MIKKTDSEQTNPKRSKISIKSTIGFPIVGIGASAGGLEALELFFNHVPENCGMAFVVIQHLDPKHVGMMPELLQRMTSLIVTQAKDRGVVQQNCVYVIPPNKSISILNGALHLFSPVESHGLRLPIDIFFRSLAIDRQEKSIGIILSGMGSDGSLGVKAIKEKNGLILIQDTASAKYDGMPRSASEAVNADIIASPEELPGKLIAYLKTGLQQKPESVIENNNKSDIEKIVILLREQTGHDFSMYKNNTLFRRIERRKDVHQIEKINNYVRFLQENPVEIEILFKELLIGVTSFFRDVNVWDILGNDVLPNLIQKSNNGHILRAWVPACSTGEEAYSLAMLFAEAMGKFKKLKNISLQVFATDLDIDAIEKARKGVFSNNIISDVSAERLEKYFIADGETYRLKSFIREMVVFAPQDVIKDPPFTKLDILSCRNMLIYMESELQNKLISLFNYCLNSNGILILGTSESLGKQSNLFTDINPKLKIFQHKKSLVLHDIIDFPSSFYNTKQESATMKKSPKIVENIQTITDQILLQQFAPASVLVNDKGDIVYITGRTGKYLEPVAGKANWNIYAMAREGLRDVLPGTFRKAMQNFSKVKISNIKVGINGGTQYIDLIVQRLEKPEALHNMIIFIFKDVDEIIKPDDIGSKTTKQISTSHQKEIEMDLKRCNEDLQSLREEMQTSQEELKSTNEELQSTNEELQSTNEELTTSKEEMQSLNEELQSVNAELQSKVNDYLRANDDMKNLLNSTEIATLFLDKELNIRRYTEQTTNIFKLREEDIGRPFTDLVNHLHYPEIETHARQVLKTLTFIESSLSTNDDRWFSIRIMPYRTMEDRIDGLVITFTDISIAKKLELELIKANEKLKEIKKS